MNALRESWKDTLNRGARLELVVAGDEPPTNGVSNEGVTLIFQAIELREES
jgi:hypothetical protein